MKEGRGGGGREREGGEKGWREEVLWVGWRDFIRLLCAGRSQYGCTFVGVEQPSCTLYIFCVEKEGDSVSS